MVVRHTIKQAEPSQMPPNAKSLNIALQCYDTNMSVGQTSSFAYWPTLPPTTESTLFFALVAHVLPTFVRHTAQHGNLFSESELKCLTDAHSHRPNVHEHAAYYN